MATFTADLVVVGGGPAGVTAALRARELGATVTLVERARLGGTCTNDGCVPTRALAKAARLVRDADQFADYGLAGAAPTVDLAAVMERVRGAVERVQAKKDLGRHLEWTGVAVRTGAGGARFLDPQTLALAGETVRGKQFVLCVGGHARRLGFPGGELARTHSDIWTLERLPEAMVVVGGAATGCQLASIFAAFGTRVTLLEAAPTLLGDEDPAVAEAIARAFAARGIQVVTGVTGVDRLERVGDRLRLTWSADGQAATTAADEVVLAVGWPGNADNLGLEAAGVRVERGYVWVDDSLRTSQPGIWAAGDVTGRMMLVQTATAEARMATDNALLGDDRTHADHIVPHGGFTDPEYGSVGLTEAAARAGPEPVTVATVAYADLDRAVIDGRTEGFCKLVVEDRSERVVGAHVVGEQAVEVVQLVAAGMTAGMRVGQLAELELAYPTFTSIVGLAARRVTRQLGAVPVSPYWRAVEAAGLDEWERRRAD
jgi:pyruvate/2-oxoglutarate dehydrogenase complex dihydrolipoamide dehydrogenase (E3) component